jgi:hypothetical protein
VSTGGDVRKTSPLDVFALSAAAKLGATVVTYPLLLVKARAQLTKSCHAPFALISAKSDSGQNVGGANCGVSAACSADNS